MSGGSGEGRMTDTYKQSRYVVGKRYMNKQQKKKIDVDSEVKTSEADSKRGREEPGRWFSL